MNRISRNGVGDQPRPGTQAAVPSSNPVNPVNPLQNPLHPVAGAREAITYFRPLEEREADRAPLSANLIRRMFTYTRPYAARRNWLFVLTFARGLQLPALAWMIGQTINGPIAGQDLPGIYFQIGRAHV